MPNGGQISCLFYGGAGGGKRKKSSLLEVGYVIDVSFAKKKSEIKSEMETASEFQLVWNYDQLRLSHNAFYLLSFYLELILKVARPLEHDELDLEEHGELFNVLSNAIFFLEQDCANINETKFKHLSLFLTKLSHAMGVYPEVSECLYCGIDLNEAQSYALLKNEGGFACGDCLSQKEEQQVDRRTLDMSKRLRATVVQSIRTLYKDHQQLSNVGAEESNELMEYLFFQFHFQKHQFKTLRMLF